MDNPHSKKLEGKNNWKDTNYNQSQKIKKIGHNSWRERLIWSQW